MDSQGFNSLFPILSMAGRARWARRWHSTGGRNRTVHSQSGTRGDYSRPAGRWRTVDYGVTLPRMKPFITACLGGAAAVCLSD